MATSAMATHIKASAISFITFSGFGSLFLELCTLLGSEHEQSTKH